MKRIIIAFYSVMFFVLTCGFLEQTFFAFPHKNSSASTPLVPACSISWVVGNLSTSTTGGVCLAYGASIFTGICGGSTVITSSDGISWIEQGSIPGFSCSSIIYGDKFVAVGNYGTDCAATSADGISWTVRSAPEYAWSSVAYGNGVYVAIGDAGTPKQISMVSSDGVSWNENFIPVTITAGNIVFGNGIFVAVDGNISVQSSNGVSWTSATFSIPYGSLFNTAFGNGKFVSLEDNYSQVIVSSDGANWDVYSMPVTNYWNAFCWGGGQYIALSSIAGEHQCWASLDGINWVENTVPIAKDWKAITYGNNKYVAANDGGAVSQMITSDCN